MQPKWMLYSMSILGLLILVATNVLQAFSDVLPSTIVTGINTVVPILLMIRRVLGEQVPGGASVNAGTAPLTLLPPSKADKLASLSEQ